MLTKQFYRKPIFWFLLVLIILILSFPAFLSHVGGRCNPLTRTIFSIDPEDEITVILDCSPREGWSVELTDENRDAAIAVLNNLHYWCYYPDPSLFLSAGAGWEQAVLLKCNDKTGQRYHFWNNHLKVGPFIFFINTDELFELFETYQPD